MQKSRLNIAKQHKLIEHFVAGTTARCAADLVAVNHKTAAYYYHRLREIIAYKLSQESEEFLSGENVLDVSEFKHYRINHSKLFADKHNHINGIGNFWNQAKHHMRKFNGVPKKHFRCF